ncbi:hypothetical protein KO495_00445, partial [Colwellia sp. D2M02]|nr:hypothetical protein [Colwellia sp. D2M02]
MFSWLGFGKKQDQAEEEKIATEATTVQVDNTDETISEPIAEQVVDKAKEVVVTTDEVLNTDLPEPEPE